MSGPELRAKRVSAGISGAVFCLKAGIGRTLLSGIERGTSAVTPETGGIKIWAKARLEGSGHRVPYPNTSCAVQSRMGCQSNPWVRRETLASFGCGFATGALARFGLSCLRMPIADKMV
jgi:hypothetical protein